MNSPTSLLSFAILCTALPSQLLHAGIVTTAADSGSGSLRAAISAAANGETITFAPGLNGATITLTSGELAISGLQLSIDASALSKPMKISGNASSRIFHISGNAIVSLNSLEIFNGLSLNSNGGGVFALQSQLNFINVTIRNCTSTFDGGGLWANSVTGILDRCSILGNDSQGFGGGIFLGSISPAIKNSVIAGNRGGVGGGIANFSASPVMTNCTIQGNSGAGVQLESSASPILRNTVIWGNRTGEDSISSQQIRTGNSSTASASINYCLVEGFAGTGTNLNGTLSTSNPKFVNPVVPTGSATPPTAISDLRVFTSSSVFDVGSNTLNISPLDRAGLPRIQNTTIDLGAFEGGYVTFSYLHPALSPSGDSNGNGLSNFLEYAAGIDPTGPDNPSARPKFSANGGFYFLTSSLRTNALDADIFWQTSTTLGALSWQKMIAGINYTIESSSSLAPSRQQVVMKLLDSGNRRFYRQGFTNGN